jgi:hypothetical protein
MNKTIVIRLLIAFAFFFNVFFVSCKKETKEYRIASEFEDYVQRFLTEANKHGQNFDFHKSGLIIEFVDKLGEFDGRCYYENPIRIEIDKGYWQKYGNFANGDLLKEKVIFHELGHGFLNRKHLNELFDDGDWVSMMHGGDGANPPDGRESWNINYRGYRKAYYVNELFNTSTSAPTWATEKPVIALDTNQNSVFTENFDNNNNNWSIGVGDSTSISMANGIYTFQNGSKYRNYYLSKNIYIDKTRNFYFEMLIKFTAKSPNDACGIVWGGSTGTDLYYFCITKNQNFKIGNYSNYGWYIDVPCSKIKTNDFNKLAVRHVNNNFYLYINDVFVYQTDHDGFFGEMFGVQTSSQTTVQIDKIQISYLGASATKSNFISGNESTETFIGTTPNSNNQLVK